MTEFEKMVLHFKQWCGRHNMDVSAMKLTIEVKDATAQYHAEAALKTELAPYLVTATRPGTPDEMHGVKFEFVVAKPRGSSMWGDDIRYEPGATRV